MRTKSENKYPWLNKAEKKAQSGRLEVDTRYNSKRWRQLRSLYLQANPLCEVSHKEGRIVAATLVDHIHPVRMGGAFWSENNWQAMSDKEHARKSAFEGQLMNLMRGMDMKNMRKYYKIINKITSKQHDEELYKIDFKIIKNIFLSLQKNKGVWG